MIDAHHILMSRRISKKDICLFLGLVHPSGRLGLQTLEKNYFTDDLLIELGLDRRSYKKTRIFDAVKTKIIIGRFRLDLINPKLTILLR